MPPRCRILDHPQRETIELELARSHSVLEVAKRWDIPRRTLSAYRENHMTQEQIARLRGLVPAQAEMDIDELVRVGGTEAVAGLSRIIAEAKEGFEVCKRLGLHAEAVKYQKVQLEAFKAKGQYAGLIPGRKSVTNNNLVIGDGAALFEVMARVLNNASSIEQARELLSAEYLALAGPDGNVLEHEG